MTLTTTKSPDRQPEHLPLPAHFPALDGLRGIAILLVLVHMLSLFEPQPGVVAWLYHRVVSFGWVGVQLFFVLSGFLITGILLDTQRAQNYYAGFYARRTLRIFPLYFGVLIVAFAVLPAIGTVPPRIEIDRGNQVWLWTYMSNWAGVFGVVIKGFPHFWSLAVEEQFYLLWPLLIRSRNPQDCVRFCVLVAASSLLVRCTLAWFGVSDELIYENSFCRMDALALGGAAAAALRIPVLRDRIVAMHGRILLWSMLTMLFGAAVTRGFWNGTLVGQTVGYTFVSLMFMLLVVAASGADAADARGWATALRTRPLRAIGKYSYAMYVFHVPLRDYIGKPLVVALNVNVAQSVCRSVIFVALGILLTFAVAWLSWRFFERPILQLKRYFEPRY